MTQRRVRIFDIPIDALTQTQVLERLTNAVQARLSTQVVTVNPEFLVQSRANHSFRKVLQDAQLSVPDGIGLRAAASFRLLQAPTWQPARFLCTFVQGIWVGLSVLGWRSFLARPLPETVTGTDLVMKLAHLAQQHAWRVYLLGGDPGVAQEAAKQLRKRFPTLLILGAEEGITRDRFNDEGLRRHVADRIGQTRPDIVFVAFGAPKQDLFIAENARRLKAPIMMGVGGAFDFIAGTVTRAPSPLRALGLEWLWRLIQQPWRWHRIWTAVIVFPWLVFWDRQRT